MNKQTLTDDTTPYRRLVYALILCTVRDYCQAEDGLRHRDAALFLRSREAQEFCEAWGLDLEWIGKRLTNGAS